MGGGAHLPSKILIIGGSYAGLAATITLLSLSRGLTSTGSPSPTANSPRIPLSITLVDERDGFYHTIGSPLAFASEPYMKKAWMKFSSLPALKVPNLKIVQGSVIIVDPENKIARIKSTAGENGEREEKYDFLIAASGLRRVFPVVPQSLTEESYLEEARGHIRSIEEAEEGIVVIGGGAVGIEMAAELKVVHPTRTVKLIHSHAKLLSSEPLPDEVKDASLSLLLEAGVEVTLSQRVISAAELPSKDGKKTYKVVLGDGTSFAANHVIWALSHAMPTTTYLPSSSLTQNALIKINAFLNITSPPNPLSHFAAGDIVEWSGIKRCGAAMAMGHNAAFNIYQQLVEQETGRKGELVEFPEVGPTIGLAVGRKAVSYSPAEGMEVGESVMKAYFGGDLGLEICYNHLRLGVVPDLGGKAGSAVEK